MEHEPGRAPKLERAPAEIGIWVLIHPNLFGSELAVETPARGISSITTTELSELGNAFQLLRDRDLHVMPGNSFMVRERLQLVGGIVLHVRQVHVEHAGP